jgi:hypothetical protein
VVDEAIEKIRDGTITGYTYDPKTASLTRASGLAARAVPRDRIGGCSMRYCATSHRGECGWAPTPM